LENPSCLINHLILLRKLFKQLLFLSILLFTPSLSFAQLTDHTFETSIEEGQIYIIVQLQIRDSNESLVGYIETDRITVNNLEFLSQILDELSENSKNTKIITIDDKKYEVIVEEHSAKYVADFPLSMSNITTNDDEIVVYANYDGSPIGKGDLVITTWTMIRPA
jgi:hypothetical protein